MTSASWNQCWAWGRTETSHVQAAVDAPNLSGDVPGGIRCQEMHHSCDLPRLGQPAHWDGAFDAVDRDADTVFCQHARASLLKTRLARECFRQAEQAGFGRRIIRLADGAH